MKLNLSVLVVLILFSAVKSNEDTNNILANENLIPRIEADESLNATLGKAVSMKCIVHNLKSYKIAWYFNGILLALNNIRIKDDKRYSVENPHTNEWILNIDPVDIAHDGQYSCHVNNGLKKTINLKVGMAPIFIGNNDSHVIINVIEKQNVTLTCEAEGSPPPLIYWYKNNKLVATGTQYVKKDITRHSNAVYECVARNGIEPDPSRLFKINVNFKPSIQLMYQLTDFQNQTTKHYTNDLNELELVCEITGNPINTISWFKDGIKIKDDNHHKYRMNRNSNYNFVQTYNPTTHSSLDSRHRYKKHVSIHTSHNEKHYKYISKLRIRNYEDSDNGNYKCSVNGYEGDHSKSLTLHELIAKPFDIEEQSLLAKNSVVNKNEKFTKKISNKNEDKNSLGENNYMHERARGARYNLTKSAGMIQEKIAVDNSVAKFTFNINAFVFMVIILKSIS